MVTQQAGGRARSGASLVIQSNVRITDEQVREATAYLLEHVHGDELNPAILSTAEGKRRIMTMLTQSVTERRIPDLSSSPATIQALYDRTVGLGVIDSLMADPSVTQINIIGRRIILQSNGMWTYLEEDKWFETEEEALRVLATIFRRVGRDFQRMTRPIDDIFFDGLRIHVNALNRGANISYFIRKGRREPFSVEQLIAMGDFDRDVVRVLRDAAQRMLGVIIIGPVGVGKTVFLETYIGMLPEVPIAIADDAGDCNPHHPMVTTYDLPAPSYKTGEVPPITLSAMIRSCLRMGQVLVVGEVRDGDTAATLLRNAASMRAVATTFHADTPLQGLRRMVSEASHYAGSTVQMLSQNVADAFPIIIKADQIGGRYHIASVTYNAGYNQQRDNWELLTMVEAKYSPSGDISWDLIDLPSNVLMKKRRVAVGGHKSIADMYLSLRDKKTSEERLHILSQILIRDHGQHQARQIAKETLQELGIYDEYANQSQRAVDKLNSLIEGREWQKCREILDRLPNTKAYILFPQSRLVEIEDMVRQGLSDSDRLAMVLDQASQMISSSGDWEAADNYGIQIAEGVRSQANNDLVAQAVEMRVRILEYLSKSSPEASRPHYQTSLTQWKARYTNVR